MVVTAAKVCLHLLPSFCLFLFTLFFVFSRSQLFDAENAPKKDQEVDLVLFLSYDAVRLLAFSASYPLSFFVVLLFLSVCSSRSCSSVNSIGERIKKCLWNTRSVHFVLSLLSLSLLPLFLWLDSLLVLFSTEI
jgi:hypothetical protein